MSDRLSDKCNPHPEAPHGFDRNSSATEDRYVCDCEHWQPPDDLRTRIVAVQLEHIDRQLTNYDTGREECGCGQQGNATYMEHLADAVIEALELTDTLRLLRAAQIWIADAISEDDTGEPWLMTRMLLNNLVSRVDALEGYND